MAILTLAELKESLEITVTTYDTPLTVKLEAAVEAVDFMCGPTDVITVTETVQGSGALIPRYRPILSLTSVTGQQWGAIDVDNLFATPEGTIWPRYGTLIYEDWYEIVYTAGRDTVPSGIKTGVELIAKHLWQTRRGPAAQRGGLESVAGVAFMIPKQAVEALSPFMLGPAVG